MIEISQLRLENYGQWIRLVADITSDVVRTDKESTIWIGVKNENASMLTTDVYNAFLFLPMYMSMYKQSQQLDEPDILLKETR